MSVSSTNNSRESFDNIIKALNDGKRIVYDKTSQKFIVKTRSEAKEGKANCVTDLKDLQKHILELISSLNLSVPDLKKLSEALKKRAEKNESSWFDAKKIGARNLYEIRGGIEAIIILKNNSPLIASSPGPQPSTTASQATAISTQVTTPSSISSSPPPKAPAPAKKTAEDEIFDTTSSTSSTSSASAPVAAPPPPPAPAFGGPPPPPPPGIGMPPPPPSLANAKAGPSRAQQDLTKARKKIKDEQPQPQLPSSVDIGKPETLKKLNNEQKTALIKEIDLYLNGTIISPTASKRKDDGLSSCIEKIEARQRTYAAARMKLEAPKKELERLEGEKLSMERRLLQMQESQKKGESFTFYTVKKDKETGAITKSVAIHYYSEAEMQEVNSSFQNVSPSDQADLQAMLSKDKGNHKSNEGPIAEHRTLAYLIDQQKKLIAQKASEIESQKTKVSENQAKVSLIENEKNGEVNFVDYPSYIDDRKQLKSKYGQILSILQSNVEEKKEKSQKEKKEEYLESIIGTLPHLGQERTMLTDLGAQKTLVNTADLTKILSSDEVMTESEISSGKKA